MTGVIMMMPGRSGYNSPCKWIWISYRRFILVESRWRKRELQ